MTASTSTHSNPRKQTVRPSVWRLIASMYVDLLICGFIAWILSFTFGWQSHWPTVALFLLFTEVLWCRDRLNPTAGEYCLGIRYLTSSSSQVVADIKVINPKLKLNGALVFAGVVELTMAILLFCGWTFLGKVVVWGNVVNAPLSLIYWAVAGLAFFLCSGYLLSGFKYTPWVVLVIHGWFAADFFQSYPIWKELLQSDVFYTPWVSNLLMHLAKSQSFLFLELFGLWSFFVIGVLLFSRKHLVN